MRSRLTARVIGLAALLPLLVMAVSGLGYDRFRCAITGEVSEASDESCCPAADPPSMPVANGASCCDHESARPVRLPGELSTSPALALDLVALAPAILAPPAPAPASPAPRATAHAPPRPPLVLLKHAFLI